MTDDLVKRLREGDHFEKVMSAEQAANRIEELEKACAEWAEVSQSNYQRAKAAEAKLAKAVEALDEIASGRFGGQLLMSMPPKDPAAEYARTTLTKLKGQDDEWKCPINYTGCTKNCGSYGCGN